MGSTAWAALRRLQAHPRETLAVFGLGPVGLSCVLIAKSMNLKVVGVDLIEERLGLGVACGADEVVDAGQEDVVEAVRAFSRARGVDWIDGVDCLIETSGANRAREWIIPSLRREGRAAIVGVGGEDGVINPTDIHGKACTIIGSVVFPIGWVWEFTRFLVESGLSFEAMITHRFSVDEAPEALRTADGGKCGKVLITREG